MLRRTTEFHLQYRCYDNLPSNTGYGRMMTGFITPYRHWMWKQNELWRNVHEAQFEHLRRVYKRQWFESYRVNADEYIHKYNATKAATLTQWETEMQTQDAQRLEHLHKARASAKLKAKHRDLYREVHERQFFQWYERASERLQAMTKIPYIPKDKMSEHIDAELEKYVAGKDVPYQLNFVGQMPLLEDKDGNIVQVPSHLAENHFAERPTSEATSYTPPKGATASERLSGIVSSEVNLLFDSETEAEMASVLEDMAREEDKIKTRDESSKSEEETLEQREIARRAYIDRGKVGSKFRSDWKKSGKPGAAPVAKPESPSAAGEGVKGSKKGKKPSIDSAARKKIISDATSGIKAKAFSKEEEQAYLGKHLDKAEVVGPSVGEVATNVPKLRSRVKLPSMEEVLNNPIMAAQSGKKTQSDKK
eukprot:Tbor_TRINITY_DN4257_c0_g1::TRINITY_DN4257_c0_g1_i1::g.23830::m.23830